MNEEEKALVGKFQNLYIKDFKGEPITSDDRLNYIECALITNLIEKLDKELNNLKEIEKSHQEENGKLRVEFEKVYEDNLTLAHELEQYKLLEANIDKANKIIAENKFDEGLYGLLMQEKEKNKDLEEKLKISVAILTKGTYPEENEGDNDFDKQFIAVDKVKEKIEFYKEKCVSDSYNKGFHNTRVSVLKELLEEK